jgi:hypothetical protein
VNIEGDFMQFVEAGDKNTAVISYFVVTMIQKKEKRHTTVPAAF